MDFHTHAFQCCFKYYLIGRCLIRKLKRNYEMYSYLHAHYCPGFLCTPACCFHPVVFWQDYTKPTAQFSTKLGWKMCLSPE